MRFLRQSWKKDGRQNYKMKGCSMEYFTADFVKLSSTNIKICFLSGRLATFHQIQPFQKFSSNFLNS